MTMMLKPRCTLSLLALLVAIGCRPTPPAGGDAEPVRSDGDTAAGSVPRDTTAASPGSIDTTAHADPAAGAVPGLPELRAEVMRLIGDAACADVGQCRAIGFGAKPCGGPWQYLAYSTANTDSTALNAAVARYNAKEAAINRAEGRVSDCALVPPPKLVRGNGRCVIAS